MEMGNNLMMKYIIYETTNVVNKKIYIGVHKTQFPYKFDGYLGNGIYISDKHSYMFNKTPFGAAVRKYGVDKFLRKTLMVFDTEKEALDMEIQIVNEEFIKRKDTYNVTLGGGMPPKCNKIIYQYDLEGNFIKEWPSITEASIFYNCSSSSIGKAILDGTPSLKYLWAEFKLDKINVENFKIGENKVPVYLYDLQGKFIRKYDSIADCTEDLESNRNVVSAACHAGYTILKQYYASFKKYDVYLPQSLNHVNDPIYQYDLEGNFIKEWNTLAEAVKALKLNRSSVVTSIKLGRSSKGYQWSWEKVPFMKCFKSKTKARKVGKYTLEGELIQTYNTISEAKKECASSTNALYGRLKTAGGFVWKFIDD